MLTTASEPAGRLAGGATRSGRESLLIDATSALRWGPHIPTGIARVDVSLIDGALRDYEGQIEPFAFDPGLRRCRRLTGEERDFLKWSVTGVDLFSSSRAKSMSTLRRIGYVSRIYRRNPFLTSTESHRSVAQFLARSAQRRGPRYAAWKLATRAGFFLHGAWARARLGRTLARLADPLSESANDCLVSINTCRSLQRHCTVEAIKARVHLLVYDTIPLDYPEYVSSRHAKHFEEGMKFGLRCATSCLCISKATVRSFIEWAERLGLPLSAQRVHGLHLGSPLADAELEAIELDELGGRPFVVYCSTIDARKNHELLLGVWEDLARAHGADKIPLLVLVGKAALKRDPVERMLKDDSSLRAVVRVFSRLDDQRLVWLYKNAAFAVFPSKAEGWGLGASEALDFGTPVVISDIPALREATQELMPTIDPAARSEWRAAVERLITDRATLDRLRQRVRLEYRRRPAANLLEQVLAIVGPEAARDRAQRNEGPIGRIGGLGQVV